MHVDILSSEFLALDFCHDISREVTNVTGQLIRCLPISVNINFESHDVVVITEAKRSKLLPVAQRNEALERCDRWIINIIDLYGCVDDNYGYQNLHHYGKYAPDQSLISELALVGQAHWMAELVEAAQQA